MKPSCHYSGEYNDYQSIHFKCQIMINQSQLSFYYLITSFKLCRIASLLGIELELVSFPSSMIPPPPPPGSSPLWLSRDLSGTFVWNPVPTEVTGEPYRLGSTIVLVMTQFLWRDHVTLFQKGGFTWTRAKHPTTFNIWPIDLSLHFQTQRQTRFIFCQLKNKRKCLSIRLSQKSTVSFHISK